MVDLGDCRTHIRVLHNMDESECVERLRRECDWPRKRRQAMRDRALSLIEAVRRQGPGPVEAFLLEYGLSSADGQALMVLAEALPRIPDTATKEALIGQSLARGDWRGHWGHSSSSLVNLSTAALTLAERGQGVRGIQAAIRTVMERSVQVLGDIFVMGDQLETALKRVRQADLAGYLFSFDMLGEEARTAAQAEHYFKAYAQAIATLGRLGPGYGVSVKLSALHPRYHPLQRARVLAELVPRLTELCRQAWLVNIGLTIDAEEAERLELSLDVIEAVLADPALEGWGGLGLAVQAYQKRAVGVVDWAVAAARRYGQPLAVRLVKGAYWDTEIKRAQERGLATYPVFTTKAATDLSYLACARRLLNAPGAVRPAFASHNAATLAAVLELAGDRHDWEFQRLHGMGQALHGLLRTERPCRVYAPVGPTRDLLPYLIRRLLENGANTSFIHALADQGVAAVDLVNGPVDERPLALPRLRFLPHWQQAEGLDLSDGETLPRLYRQVEAVGDVHDVAETQAPGACVNLMVDGFSAWEARPAVERASILDKAATALEVAPQPFLRLLIQEAGKTWPDALGEVREAVEFLRYYAAEARRLFAHPIALPAISGERNLLSWRGRGVFACISPWNFPLSIFLGQVAAALVAGNTVVAKSAPQTPRIAALAVALMHRAGIPRDALVWLPGDAAVGAALVADPALSGVAFTGSHAAARAISVALAAKPGALVPLIAETGGINAMIIDSTALPEQAAADIVASAFLSAGQRCSALRLLFVQDDIADKILDLVAGMVAELRVGNPMDSRCDIGPLIDADALARFGAAERELAGHARLLFRSQAPKDGAFAAPTAYMVDWDHLPKAEIFGPLLQVCRWRRDQFGQVLGWLAENGHGLTLGLHSRLDALPEQIVRTTRIGNIYVNRGMTGAMVGCQPFGGTGLSGTGPKSGGPHTLFRFAVETVLTVNTAAIGGALDLLCGKRT